MTQHDSTARSTRGRATIGSDLQFRLLAPSIGESLGSYRLEGHLGRGGMGEVFVARSLSDEVVALKYVHFAAPTLLYRFKREFRALADVHHPNLVSLGELHVLDDGRAYFTMELVEGVPFIDYVRMERQPDRRLPRLLRATTQLVEGVCHLHSIGCIHRDIKPSNVLVTASGRVVLLDFGLVLELSKPETGITHMDQLLGTPAYMAPEQARRGRCGPTSDLYSIGVMLYEAIYGSLPVTGNTMEMISAKSTGAYEIVMPETLDVPEGLVELTRALLAAEAWERPAGHEVLRVLRNLQAGAMAQELSLPSPSLVKPESTRSFVGRDRELMALLDAYDAMATARRSVCMCVSGASGQGKSTLLNQFVERLEGLGRQPVILRGRCLERESVPHRGMDEIVDSLSVFLRRLPTAQRLSLQPRHADALAQLFPVLGYLWPSDAAVQREPSEQRNEGVVALREVLTRLGDRRPLVLIIDDFHRADLDGRRILGEMFRPPDAPTMLLVVTCRESPGSLSEFLFANIEANQARDIDRRELALGPLALDDVEELVRSTLAGSRLDPSELEQFVVEASQRRDHSPFALQQWLLDVIHFGASSDGHGDVRARIARLPDLLREIVSAVALAGGPVRLEVLAEALDIDDISGLVERLSSESLLIRCNISEVDTAHDRIRKAGEERLGVAASQRLHGLLASAMAEYGVAPEILVEHLVLAGRIDDAHTQALAAAQNAAQSLAFARAARFYQRALELLPANSHRRRELRLALAEQLANDGCGLESSRIYVEMAAQTQDPVEARDLQRRAALLLFLSGRLREGLALFRGVLRELGENLPGNRLLVILTLGSERLRLALAWFRWHRRWGMSRPANARTREIVETLMTAVRGLGAQEHVLTYGLQSRALRLALAHQPSEELALLVGAESLAYLARGQSARSFALREIAEELARRSTNPLWELFFDVYNVFVDGIQLDFHRVLEHGPRIWIQLANKPSAQWLRGALCSPLACTWLYTGDLNTTRRECLKWLLAARERGNFLQAAELTSSLAMARLFVGEVESAYELLDEGARQVDASFFSMAAAATQTAQATAMTYEGKYEDAMRLARKTQRQARRAGLTQLRMVRCILEDVAGRAELALLLSGTGRGSERLRRRIERRIRWLTSNCGAMGVGFAAVMKAGLASWDKLENDAYNAWREADMAFSNCGFAGHQAVVHHRLGELGSDPGSTELRRRATAYFEAQAVAAPHALVDLLAPCSPSPSSLGAPTRREGWR